jgi:hypothetical protein
MPENTEVVAAGEHLAATTHLQGWRNMLATAPYSPAVSLSLADDLFTETVRGLNARLPEGMVWLPVAAHIVGPPGAELPGNFNDLMQQATDAAGNQIHVFADRYTRRRRDRTSADLATALELNTRGKVTVTEDGTAVIVLTSMEVKELLAAYREREHDRS